MGSVARVNPKKVLPISPMKSLPLGKLKIKNPATPATRVYETM